MNTSEVVKRTGIDRETLRFYENKGLIDSPRRTDSGYRIFSDNDILRLEFIHRSKRAGFTLSEIVELVEMKNVGLTCRDGRDVAQNKLQQVKDKMKALREMQKILNSFIQACECEGEAGLNKTCHLSFDSISFTKQNKSNTDKGTKNGKKN